MKSQLIHYRDNKGEWRWRFIAENGRQLSKSSEGYKNFKDCEKSFALTRNSDYKTVKQ